MAERILFLTGHLARPRLERILAETDALGFAWSVLDVGVKVAALMTEAIILRRLPRPIDADRVMVPGSLSRRPRTAHDGTWRPVRSRPR